MSPASQPLATSGPLFPALGPVDWPIWERAAAALRGALPPSQDQERRIHQLSLPVLFAIAAFARHKRPLVVGVSGPQGCGKTTLVRSLVPRLSDHFGLGAVSISIDDFYLTHAEQQQLAAAHPDNRYLQYRGHAGTHDLALGSATLDALLRLGDGELRLPTYDKSAMAGRGDRAPESSWPLVRGTVEVILFEGWMLGFEPVDPALLLEPAQREVNGLLGGYESWHQRIDALVDLRAADPNDIVKWRVEAEESMAKAGRPALDRAAILDYIGRFLWAYEAYAGRVSHGRWSPDRQLVATLGADRLPVAAGSGAMTR
jgi:D-glycerate 3-kinase